MRGYIQLHRSIQDHWIWRDPEYLRRWISLLMLAAWDDRNVATKNGSVFERRGEIRISYRSLGKHWGCAPNTAVSFVEQLARDGMVTVEPGHTCTSIFIVNYDKYQSPVERLGTEEKRISSEQKSGQETAHIKEKEIKNQEKKEEPSLSQEEKFFEEVLGEEEYLNRLAREFGFEVDEIIAWLREEHRKWNLRGDRHVSLEEYKKHIYNSLNYRRMNGSRTNKNFSYGPEHTSAAKDVAEDKYSARRGTPARVHSAKDYGGSF